MSTSRHRRKGRPLWSGLSVGSGLVVLLLTALGFAPQARVGPPFQFDLLFGARIPLRDGVQLSASLYLPERDGKPSPVLLLLTPYGSDNFHREASALARRGFVVAAVNVRGRGGSEGVFEPWVHEGRDGYDVVEWLAQQSWSNGQVGMFGHSYGGRAVWSTLRELPPHLKAAVPIAPSLGMAGFKNILTPDLMQWLLLTAGATANTRLASDSEFWVAKYRELYLSERPLAEFDEIVGSPLALFDHFLAHPTLDEYWRSISPKTEDFARIHLPVLTIVGQSDAGAPSALWYYRRHLEAAGAGARHQLLLGPWDHHGSLRPAREAAGLDFGPESLLDMPALLADWFSAQLSGTPPPEFLRPTVRYYLLGPNQWREASDLAEVFHPEIRFFLDAGSAAGTLARPGRLSGEPPRQDGEKGGWTFDPRDLRPGQAETEERADWLVHFDQPADLWGSGFAYSSQPMADTTRLAGEPRLKVWLSIDTPDADFAARLDIVNPEGGTSFLGEDWARARYRGSLEREELVASTEPFEVHFDFPFVARELPRGSRLRLVLYSPNSIFKAKNRNGGGVVALESGKDARTVHVSVHQGPQFPSRLEIGGWPR